MQNTDTSKKETASKTFTESANALECIVERFRDQALPIEESLALFEEGVGHIRQCQQKLSETRGKVEILVKSLQTNEENLILPFGENIES